MGQSATLTAAGQTVTLTTALAPLDLTAAAAGKPPRFSLIAYNGGLIRPNTNPPLQHPVVVDLAGMERPSKSLPILKDHDSKKHVGHTDAVAISATDVRMAGVVSGAGPDAQEVVTAARNGFVWPVSIGASMDHVELLATGKTTSVNGRTIAGPVYIVRKSKLKETSLLTVAADDAAFAHIAASAAESTVMTFPQYLAANGFGTEDTLSAEQAKALKAGWQASLTAGGTAEPDPAVAERLRVTGLAALTAGFPNVLTAALANDWTDDQVRAEMKAAKLQAQLSGPHINGTGFGGGGGTRGNAIKPEAVLTAGLMLHAGREEAAVKTYGERVVTMAADLRAHSLMDLCASALRLEDREVPRNSGSLVAAAFTTLSLPVALGNLAEKQSADAYNETPSVWRSIARRRPVNNFKPSAIIRVVLTGELEPLPPDGEIKHGGFAESSLTVQVATKAKMLGLTRVDIVNDDLSVFNDTSNALGRMAARALNDDFVKSFMGNADFFKTGNGNIVTGAGLDVAGITAALLSANKRTDQNGHPIDVRPKVLLVPPELETLARQLIASETLTRYASTTKDQLPTANPTQDVLDILVEPRLSNTKYPGNSASTFYLFSGPADGAINVAFLNGRESPVVETSDTVFNTLGVHYRCYIDYGFSPGEPLAATKVTA